MSTGQRLIQIVTSLLMLLLALMMIVVPDKSVVIVAALLSLSLTGYGILYLIYYFTMARHMVGGKLILYVSIIALDLGVFTATLLDTPQLYIFLYLIGAYAFTGAIDILRSREAKNNGGTSWRLKLVHGVVSLLIALACVVFLQKTDVLVIIYAIGLIYSALMRIVTAFRKTAVIYIQ